LGKRKRNLEACRAKKKKNTNSGKKKKQKTKTQRKRKKKNTENPPTKHREKTQKGVNQIFRRLKEEERCKKKG